MLSLPMTAVAQLTEPVGGWQRAEAGAPFTQTVNYPASSVTLDAEVPAGSRILGRIASAGKGPATLVVNGNAMPLERDEDGRFARAYSFGAGSNSVEIRGEGVAPLRRQFYRVPGGEPLARLRILLAWDTPGTDLDLHVVTPAGEHAFYAQRVVQGGALDVDVTTGYGPEIFASPAPPTGPWQVWVNYYGGGEGLTTARLVIVSNEGLPAERRQEFVVPMRRAGELTLVKQFVYP